jgi:hypothetical protein
MTKEQWKKSDIGEFTNMKIKKMMGNASDFHRYTKCAKRPEVIDLLKSGIKDRWKRDDF